MMIRSLLLPLVRGWLNALRSDAEWIPAVSKLLRAMLMVPPFGLLLVALRVRLRFRGPLVVEGRTAFGAKMKCHLPDLIQMYVYLFGWWEPDLTRFIEERLSEEDVFVDVGANVGYDALLACRGGGDGDWVRVVAIEPSPAIVAQLWENLERNGCADRVRVIERAVSDRIEALDLFAGPHHNIGLTATVQHRGMKRAGAVRGAPLADFLEDDEIRRTRIIKIDVEGAEDGVLRSIVPLLDRCREDMEILVELSPRWWSDRAQTMDDVLRPLIEAGFHVYTIRNSYWPWRYLWPNCVARPRRLRRSKRRRRRRLDVVLSRLDCDVL